MKSTYYISSCLLEREAYGHWKTRLFGCMLDEFLCGSLCHYWEIGMDVEEL